jgi:invasion protein IalB
MAVGIKRLLILGMFWATFIIFLGAPVQSSGIKSDKVFKEWSVHIVGQKKKRICYIHGKPRKSAGKYKLRGPTYMQVTHRMANRARNEVSITAGYTFKKDSAVSVKIDKKTYSMYTAGTTAWSQDDATLVAAMRAGTSMNVTGTSKRGTVTKDRYSLSGFTAAHKAINRACNKK